MLRKIGVAIPRERRSSSGLDSIDRKIESEKEDVTDVSDVLNQKTSQLESIERLIVSANERLITEKESLTNYEQELEFAKNPEEEQNAKFRISTITDHIQELESEIKIREKMAKKITDEVAQINDIKSKITFSPYDFEISSTDNKFINNFSFIYFKNT